MQQQEKMMAIPIRMLILEDRPSDAELMLHELKKAGFDPIFRRVETKEDFLANLDPAPEIILADYSMPQFDALLALSLLKEKGLDIPFIVVTGAIGDEIAIECMKQGASDYLLKDRMARLGIAVAHSLEEKKIREEQKRVQISLQESEEKFRTLFNHASDGIIIHDLEARILEVNQVICDRLGYTREELLKMTLMEIDTPDYAAMVKGKMKELLTEERIFFESANIHRDGTVIPIELSSRLINFEGTQAVLSITRDITVRKRAEEAIKRLNAELETRVIERTRALQEEIAERHKAEKALEESRRTLGTLLSNLPGIAYRCRNDTEWPMELVSDGCVPITGFSPEDFISGRVIYRHLIFDEDREKVGNDIQKAIDLKRPFTITYRIKDAWGNEKWVWEQGCGVFNDMNDLLALEGFIIDSTERKQRELDIKMKAHQLAVINDIVTIISPTQSFSVIYRKSMDKLQKVLSFDTVALYRLSPRRHVIEYQYSAGNPLPEEFMTKFPNFRTDNEELSPLIFHRRPLYLEGPSVLWGLDQSGTKHMAVVPLRTESKVIGMIIALRSGGGPIADNERSILDELGKQIGDIIEEATLHAELKRLHEESNLYLDILVHDINDANTRSFGYIDILTEMLSGKTKEYAVTTKKGIEQSIEIIRKVTLIRRIREKTTELAPVNLDTIIQTEILRNRKAAIIYEPCSIQVLADDLLSEVFANLINNSVTFGGPFVTIRIEVERNDDFVVISVIDNGPGIPDSVKQKLFARSSQGSAKGSGKGLGLYIVKVLLDRYGGKIKVRDRLENGIPDGLVMMVSLKTASGDQK